MSNDLAYCIGKGVKRGRAQHVHMLPLSSVRLPEGEVLVVGCPGLAICQGRQRRLGS
jgi:hypothetical protein